MEVGDAEDSAAAGVVGVAVKVLGDAAGACVTGAGVAGASVAGGSGAAAAATTAAAAGGALICF